MAYSIKQVNFNDLKDLFDHEIKLDFLEIKKRIFKIDDDKFAFIILYYYLYNYLTYKYGTKEKIYPYRKKIQNLIDKKITINYQTKEYIDTLFSTNNTFGPFKRKKVLFSKGLYFLCYKKTINNLLVFKRRILLEKISEKQYKIKNLRGIKFYYHCIDENTSNDKIENDKERLVNKFINNHKFVLKFPAKEYYKKFLFNKIEDYDNIVKNKTNELLCEVINEKDLSFIYSSTKEELSLITQGKSLNNPLIVILGLVVYGRENNDENKTFWKDFNKYFNIQYSQSNINKLRNELTEYIISINKSKATTFKIAYNTDCEFMHNILMNSFTSKYASERLFSSLQDYYNLRLGKDLTKYTFFDAKDYLKGKNLAIHIYKAIDRAPKFSNKVILDMLNYIDSFYENPDIVLKENNYFCKLANEWKNSENSSFDSKYNYIWKDEDQKPKHGSVILTSRPTLFFNQNELKNIYVDIPPQLIKHNESVDNYEIQINGMAIDNLMYFEKRKLEIDSYDKDCHEYYDLTENCKIKLNESVLFKDIQIDITYGDEIIRSLKKIKSKSFRLFNDKRQLIAIDYIKKLSPGNYYLIAEADYNLSQIDNGLIINEEFLGEKKVIQLKLFDGDILRIDNYCLPVGTFKDGFVNKKELNTDLYVLYNEEIINIYNDYPVLRVVAINNSKRHKILTLEVKDLLSNSIVSPKGGIRISNNEILDMKETSILDIHLNNYLKPYGNGIFNIAIDISKGEKKKNHYEFKIAIDRFANIRFDNSPYYFVERGSLSLSSDILNMYNKTISFNILNEIIDENITVFDRNICFKIKDNIYIKAFIPALYYKFSDDTIWQCKKIEDHLYKDIKDKSICISMIINGKCSTFLSLQYYLANKKEYKRINPNSNIEENGVDFVLGTIDSYNNYFVSLFLSTNFENKVKLFDVQFKTLFDKEKCNISLVGNEIHATFIYKGIDRVQFALETNRGQKLIDYKDIKSCNNIFQLDEPLKVGKYRVKLRDSDNTYNDFQPYLHKLKATKEDFEISEAMLNLDMYYEKKSTETVVDNLQAVYNDKTYNVVSSFEYLYIKLPLKFLSDGYHLQIKDVINNLIIVSFDKDSLLPFEICSNEKFAVYKLLIKDELEPDTLVSIVLEDVSNESFYYKPNFSYRFDKAIYYDELNGKIKLIDHEKETIKSINLDNDESKLILQDGKVTLEFAIPTIKWAMGNSSSEVQTFKNSKIGEIEYKSDKDAILFKCSNNNSTISIKDEENNLITKLSPINKIFKFNLSSINDLFLSENKILLKLYVDNLFIDDFIVKDNSNERIVLINPKEIKNDILVGIIKDETTKYQIYNLGEKEEKFVFFGTPTVFIGHKKNKMLYYRVKAGSKTLKEMDILENLTRKIINGEIYYGYILDSGLYRDKIIPNEENHFKIELIDDLYDLYIKYDINEFFCFSQKAFFTNIISFVYKDNKVEYDLKTDMANVSIPNTIFEIDKTGNLIITDNGVELVVQIPAPFIYDELSEKYVSPFLENKSIPLIKNKKIEIRFPRNIIEDDILLDGNKYEELKHGMIFYFSVETKSNEMFAPKYVKILTIDGHDIEIEYRYRNT